MSDYDYDVAKFMLKRGQPLPVDLHTRLIAKGIDVPKLEKKYGG